MPNLLVENIDETLLEKQRLALGNLITNMCDQEYTEEEGEMLEEVSGLLNMLDHWSKKTFVDVRVRVKEWYDKANGNYYFSASVWVEGTLKVRLPLQYGYGDHGLDEAMRAFSNLTDSPSMKPGQTPWRYCEENKMRLEYNKEDGCLKRDVKVWGEGA